MHLCLGKAEMRAGLTKSQILAQQKLGAWHRAQISLMQGQILALGPGPYYLALTLTQGPWPWLAVCRRLAWPVAQAVG